MAKLEHGTLQDEMTGWRRELHANPEFGFEEKRTAAFVAAKLREFGLDDVTEGIGGTGVVGALKRGSGNRSIALRADMDALRITEQGDHAHRSRSPGIMHACGHDGHTTMLLGAAKLLAEEGGFDGTVRFLFQPAEEWGKGALAMLACSPAPRRAGSTLAPPHCRRPMPSRACSAARATTTSSTAPATCSRRSTPSAARAFRCSATKASAR